MDFAPLPSPRHPNRLYFASARSGNVGGLRNESGIEDAERGRLISDMYATELDGGAWSQPSPVGTLLNTPRHEVAIDFSEDGQILFFFRGFSLFSGNILTDTAAARDELRPEPTAANLPMRPELGDGDPYFFRDTFVVFSSRRAGGEGGSDIWWSVFSKEEGAWSRPANFGPAINSGYDEATPFLARDGRTLFFSSNSLASMGGFDVFSSKFDDRTGAWPEAKNLGLPINSPGDEQYFRLSASGSTATFSSDRFGGSGLRDIHVAHFKKDRPEQLAISNPLIFNQITQSEKPPAPEIPVELTERDSLIPPIFYEDDRDLTASLNLRRIDGFAVLANLLPEATAVVTCHTDDADPGKFALYSGIKRAETVAQILLDRGVPANRIIVRSAGAQYPIAKNVIDAEPNQTGRRLNRRVELTLHLPGAARPKVGVERPIVGPVMAADGAEFFEEMNQGLAYRVEVAETKQILGGDELMMFGNLLVEGAAEGGKYTWSAGLFKTFEAASALKKELARQGFREAKVVATVNSLRLTREAAKAFQHLGSRRPFSGRLPRRFSHRPKKGGRGQKLGLRRHPPLRLRPRRHGAALLDVRRRRTHRPLCLGEPLCENPHGLPFGEKAGKSPLAAARHARREVARQRFGRQNHGTRRAARAHGLPRAGPLRAHLRAMDAAGHAARHPGHRTGGREDRRAAGGEEKIGGLGRFKSMNGESPQPLPNPNQR